MKYRIKKIRNKVYVVEKKPFLGCWENAIGDESLTWPSIEDCLHWIRCRLGYSKGTLKIGYIENLYFNKYSGRYEES